MDVARCFPNRYTGRQKIPVRFAQLTTEMWDQRLAEPVLLGLLRTGLHLKTVQFRAANLAVLVEGLGLLPPKLA